MFDRMTKAEDGTIHHHAHRPRHDRNARDGNR
jgi:hypothetical protein